MLPPTAGLSELTSLPSWGIKSLLCQRLRWVGHSQSLPAKVENCSATVPMESAW